MLALAAVGVLVLVLYGLPRIFVGAGELTDAERLKAENDVRTTLVQALAGAILLFGLYYTGRTYVLNREGQVTERFTRAIDQLGNEKSLDVRLGGIYALERIANESARDHWPIIEVLTAFVREHARWVAANANRALETDVKAVLTVLGRRNRAHETADQFLDLTGTNLRGAKLNEAPLEGADLREAHLEGANLDRAHLEGANLDRVHLEDATLIGAHLERARVRAAHLNGANLYRAHLKYASLYRAHLERAGLIEAYLEDANLSTAHLEDANLREAHLERARLDRADLEGASLLGAHLEGANLREAHLEGADLREVSGLTSEQVAGASRNELTKLPEGVEWGEIPARD